MHPATARAPSHLLRFQFVLGLPLGRGQAYLGLTDSTNVELATLNLLFDDGTEQRLELTGGDAVTIRTPTPQLFEAAIGKSLPGMGFVIWVPDGALKRQQPMLTLNGQVGDLNSVQLADAATILANPPLLAAYGHALLALAKDKKDKALQRALAMPLAQLAEARGNALVGRIEQCWRLSGNLLIIGRLECESGELSAVRLKAGRGPALDLAEAIHYVPLSGGRDAQGHLLRGHATAFFVLAKANVVPKGAMATLTLATRHLGTCTYSIRPLETDLAGLPDILNQHLALAEPLLAALRTHMRSPAARVQLAQAARANFDAQWTEARQVLRYANACAAGVTAAYALEEQGLLIFGWLAKPDESPARIWLHSPDNAPLDISQRVELQPVMEDETKSIRDVLPEAGRNLYFVVHASLATPGAARRALRVTLPGVPDMWLRIETPELRPRGLNLARAILRNFTTSEYLWRNFSRILDKGLGGALEWAGFQNPATRSKPHVFSYGTPVARPRISVIVPLYGRCDFARHQLAQFCDDPDFAEVDLIYVVDDPALHTEMLNLAYSYHPLFQVPFRVVCYMENRGFSGANNCGVEYARAPLLLLMNSDVLPQQPGWLSTLRRAFERLPDCGMAAPLLQFADGSVQHAGMEPIRKRECPELVFSHHPGRGMEWNGGEKPVEALMLTGACWLLRKRDYAAVGGLDEGYLVGDFEDADLSLRIRALGKRLYLVPAAKLWHLERQSQYQGANTKNVRILFSRFNAWRYTRKIGNGLLPNPEKLKVGR